MHCAFSTGSIQALLVAYADLTTGAWLGLSMKKIREVISASANLFIRKRLLCDEGVSTKRVLYVFLHPWKFFGLVFSQHWGWKLLEMCSSCLSWDNAFSEQISLAEIRIRHWRKSKRWDIHISSQYSTIIWQQWNGLSQTEVVVFVII